MGEIRVVMLGNYDLPDLLFLFCLSDHNWHNLLHFVVYLQAAVLFVVGEFFNYSNS